MAVEPDSEILAEEVLRAQVYALLAAPLARVPDPVGLAALSALRSDDSPFGHAVAALATRAAGTDPERLRREYEELFIGVGRGELTPYASYYLTGFLNEKPLARLRRDLARLGVERRPGVREPEDHVASLLETMSGLVSGRFGPGGLKVQKDFFHTHLLPWAPHFFRDLAGLGRISAFYAAVGALGGLFLEIEEAGFAMA